MSEALPIAGAIERRESVPHVSRLRVLRKLPLFWKLLVPFLAIELVIGYFGGFLIIRYLSDRAKTTIEQTLSTRFYETRSWLHDRNLYLIESVNLAANLDGMVKAISSNDPGNVQRLLASVLALKPELSMVSIANTRGASLSEFLARPGGGFATAQTTSWQDSTVVRDALAMTSPTRSAGFVIVDGTPMFAVAEPVCSTNAGCSPVGVAIVAVKASLLTSGAALAAAPSEKEELALFDLEGHLVGASGGAAGWSAPPPTALAGLRSVSQREQGRDYATVYGPIESESHVAAIVAVRTATASLFSAARRAGLNVVYILIAAMAATVGLGALLTRSILAQVRPLVATSRAIAEGSLDARAPIVTDDELGGLADSVNRMAEHLQASYETLELRVEQRTQEIKRLLSERTNFFTAISHELRTPLAVILGEASLLGESTRNRNVRDSTRIVHQCASQVLELVNNILDLARAEAGRIDLDKSSIDPNDVIAEIEAQFRTRAVAADVSLKTRAVKGLPRISADRSRLREILTNLVDNAIKYTPAGGHVRISATDADSFVEFSVADSGIGIPVEASDQIFEPFFRVEGSRTQGGQSSSGLGLAITKGLVEAHGGTIRFTSAPGKGTTFVFTMPLAKTKGSSAEGGAA
ncbi:MAG: sensor histidine kinase [Actinomycetota bacterium]